MINELGFPKGLIAVEKDLAQLSLINPNRRIDLLCYAPGKDGLKPLLLIECKVGRIKPQAERQVFGYNNAIGAPFIALASDTEIKMFWQELGRIVSVPFLPPFSQLVDQLCLI